jgi:predicted  nucleic acid-binding Zn-ribbon protein
VQEAGVFFSVDGFTDIKLGLECDLALALGKNHGDQVEFYGDVFVSTEGAGIDMGMKTPWVHPFGIPGVTFEQSELSVTIGPTFVPTQFGIAGGIQIGDVEGSAAVYADLMDITHSCIAAELENIDLAKIVNSILGNVVHIPSSLSRTFLDVSFEKVAMAANLAGHPIVYNGHTYDPGFRFEIDKLDLWEIIKGSALIDIDLTKGLEVEGNLEAVHFGDVITISGVESKTSPVRLTIRLMKDEIPKFLMDGAVDILGLYLASEVELDDERAMVFVEFKDNLFDFLMNLTSIGELPHPSDFSVLGELNDGVLDWISQNIPKEVDKAKSVVDKELDEALDWLKKKQTSVDGIEDQIKKIKAEDQRVLSAAEKKVLNAKNDVARMKAHVDQLSNEIHDYEDKLHHLHWYEAWKKVKYSAIIAGLWVAKEAADGVLDIAEGVLDLAEKALEHIPDVDPRVIALEAEHGVAEAALVAAEEVVKATRASFDGLAKVIEWAAKEVGEIFNVEEAMISGSFSKLKQGDLCDVELKGVFIGHHVDFNVDLDLTSIDKFLADIWHALTKLL